MKQPEILSAAQLGARLRVLISDRIERPTAWLESHLPAENLDELQVVRPSLEDVFVSCTGVRPQ